MADTTELAADADADGVDAPERDRAARTAHSEHTIAITDDGAEILTLPK